VGLSAGIFATNSGGNVDVGSSGSVSAASYVGTAVGAFARASTDTASINNSGDIASSATYGDAYGVLVRGAYGDAVNSGSIVAEGYYSANGAYVDGVFGASMDNSGSISASAVGDAIGVNVAAIYGYADVANSGDISAGS